MTRDAHLRFFPAMNFGAGAPFAQSVFAAGGGHSGVPAAPSVLDTIGGLPVTNSMVFSWLVAAALIVLIRLLAGRPADVPTRGQSALEILFGGLRDMLAPIVGARVIPHAFPLLCAFFGYILVMNWSGVLLGFFAEFAPFLRPANADLNTTLALALVSFAGWLYFVLRYAGLRALARDTFGNKADRREVGAGMYAFLTLLFIAVGFIEVISILFRPVSLAFRLYGNVFGGENLMHQIGQLAPVLVPVAASALELLIGLIQALVFTLLSAVYIGLVCNHGDEGHAEDGEHAAG